MHADDAHRLPPSQTLSMLALHWAAALKRRSAQQQQRAAVQMQTLGSRPKTLGKGIDFERNYEVVV